MPDDNKSNTNQAGVGVPDQSTTQPSVAPTTTVGTTNSQADMSLSSQSPTGTENVDVPPPPIITQQNADDTNQETPPMDIPPVVSMGGGGKKSNRAIKTIATVLSVILLLGAVGVGVYLTQQQQDIREKAACGSGCGNAPDPLPPYVGTPATVGPFDTAGKLVIYYAILESGGGRNITIRHKGTDYNIDLGNLGSGQRREVLTNINLSAKDSITVVSVEEFGNSPQNCAPVQGPPYYAIGWMGVNGDLTCGSGLPGPPSQCIPFVNMSVSSHISWAEGLKRPITDKQCWGDWREWTGDYDFNDFFIMFAVEPEAPPPPPPPASCNNTCSQNADCETGLTCSSGSCRNPECTGETDCSCPPPPPPPPAACNESCTFNDDCQAGLTCSSGSCRNPGCVSETSCTCPPPEEDSALCQDVRAYTVNGDPGNPAATWTKLTAAQLNELQSGDVVVIAVAGWSSTPTMTNGGFDKAVFSINGVDRQEVTSARPKSAGDPPDTWELYEIYTIPDGITSFTIRAKLHHQTTGWY